MNLFDKVKVVCALVVMGLGLAAYSAAPTVTSVTAQQRYPWNGLVDIVVTFNGAQSDVAKANCTFAATNSATKTALAIAHVTQQGNDTGSGTTWTRRFIWDTNADLGEVKIEDVELVVDVDTSGVVQLWEGGPYWATCNVGASKPEEYGLYFWWGDTVGHADEWGFNEANCPTWHKSESELRSLGYIDSSGNLALAHDAARVHLGVPWRMPTAAELEALVCNCDTLWTTHNGVNGRLVKGRGVYASKSIFLPAVGIGDDSYFRDLGSCGWFWSSTMYSGSFADFFDITGGGGLCASLHREFHSWTASFASTGRLFVQFVDFLNRHTAFVRRICLLTTGRGCGSLRRRSGFAFRLRGRRMRRGRRRW